MTLRKNCEHCGDDFSARRSYVRFCGNSCSNRWKARNFPQPKSCFKPGNAPWNAGKSVSGMSGKRHRCESKEKIRTANSGDRAPNWRGGLTELHYRERRSERYSAWRKSVFERDNYTCCECGARCSEGNRVRLEADHIKPFSTYPELRCDVSNGRTLCSQCHRKTPTYGAGKNRQAFLEAEGFPPLDVEARKPVDA